MEFHARDLSQNAEGQANHFQLISIQIDTWSVSDVMVIVTGNGHSDTSSNPGQSWLLFIYH